MEQDSDSEKVFVLWCEVCAHSGHERSGLQSRIEIDAGFLVDIASSQRPTRPGEVNAERLVVRHVPESPQEVFHLVPPIMAGVLPAPQQLVAAGKAFFGVAHDNPAYLFELDPFIVAELIERQPLPGAAVQDQAAGPVHEHTVRHPA